MFEGKEGNGVGEGVSGISVPLLHHFWRGAEEGDFYPLLCGEWSDGEERKNIFGEEGKMEFPPKI